MKKFVAGLTTLMFLFTAYPASGVEREKEDRAWVSFGVCYNYVYFDDELFEDFFHNEVIPSASLGLGFYPFRNFEVATQASMIYEKGRAEGELTEEESGEKFKLTIYPFQLNLTYRFDFLNEQIFVPWVSAGADYYLYRENREIGDDVEGGKAGYHAGAGLALLMDRADPDAAASLKSDFKVKNTFFDIKWEWAAIGEDDDGLDFSNQRFSLGLSFEF
jgi:hypothetical protein